MYKAQVLAIVAEALTKDAPRLWAEVEGVAEAVATRVMQSLPAKSYAITTGDAATTVTGSDGTYSMVTVWLDGDAQTTANKRAVQLPYGVAAPAVGQKWLVDFPQGRGAPGLLDKRIA